MAQTTARPSAGPRELTIRGVILGGVITLIFTAANVYLGLKVGITFATAIPAAVISMALLHRIGNSTIQENNIVQTIASAAGTLSAIIFVLPGLVIIGWWSGFHYWTTLALCIVGGILGVMYSVPLRRALVTNSELPYPEGVAAAEVLKVGSGEDTNPERNRQGLWAIVKGAVAAAGFAILAATKLVSSEVSTAFRVGNGGTAISASLSLALIGVGHLVGLTVAIAMLVGLVISWGVLVPMKTSGHLSGGPLADIVSGTFSSEVRFVGAGAIAVAAIWTLLKIIGPIVRGIAQAVASTRNRRSGQQVELVEQDLPITVVGGVIIAALIPIGLLLWAFLADTTLHSAFGVILLSLIFVLIISAVIAAVCGYMAGLIGSSNSPISGVGILVVLLASLLMVAVYGRGGSPSHVTSVVAYVLFVTAVVFGVATISNDNLQDLKTGQLVGATPWKQQASLVIGVVFGAIVIAPVLDLLNSAFGFQGAPGVGKDALAAPQASLMTSLAKGVLGGSLDWGLIGLGAAIGAAAIVVDEILTRSTKRMSLPPLAVGMGLYLPMAVTLLIPIGAILGVVYNRWMSTRRDPEHGRRLGVLMATGLIVGDSIMGVLIAALIAATGDDAPLAVVGDSFANASEWIGMAVFVVLLAVLYQSTRRAAAKDD
ncbi:OPT family oligopeptide transporter [Flexivirga meconopsidis]|uniref:OPT family oligopeptide transporter n=1 Tax=Flexivirga meconopsidis TaxID=2977121 RepID=UPI0022401152|nr:oligopeptide transporter, OPT family [Flexivirga meconopsidis]